MAADVRAFLDEEIQAAAAVLWPGAHVQLGTPANSVTGYVRQILVDQEVMFAKVSLLGLSLASALRGPGGMEALRAAQAEYVAKPGGLLAREAAQLRMLREGRLQVCETAGLERGVLFTRPVPGPTLMNLLELHPQEAPRLLGAVSEELRVLDSPHMTVRVKDTAIRERSIVATFGRKFDSGARDCLSYLATTGYGPTLVPVVERLLRHQGSVLYRPGAVQYGDLKPEHVIYPGGPSDRPVFIDPGLSLGHAGSDVAKLVSRVVLRLLTAPSSSFPVLLEGVGAYAKASGQQSESWLRHLAVLWLMDTVNITTTYLAAPDDLPLPDLGVGSVRRAQPILRFLDRASDALEYARKPRELWRRVMDEAAQAAAS
jgi:hypothetical protein